MNPEQTKLIEQFPLVAKDQPETKQNPYTGVKCQLEPLAASIFDFIVEADGVGASDALGQYETVYYRQQVIPMKLWHEARYLFRDLWPSEYMDLLD
jgi:hypothetical protein